MALDSTNKAKGVDKTVILLVRYLRQRHITRKIELKETQTLDDLQEAIINKALCWFDPHLYSFFLDNIAYSENCDMEYRFNPEPGKPSFIDIIGGYGKPHSTKTLLKNIPLRLNQKFLFVFDFGDDHHFSITVIGYGDIQMGVQYPLVLEAKGKAPEQYPEFDEEADS